MEGLGSAPSDTEPGAAEADGSEDAHSCLGTPPGSPTSGKGGWGSTKSSPRPGPSFSGAQFEGEKSPSASFVDGAKVNGMGEMGPGVTRGMTHDETNRVLKVRAILPAWVEEAEIRAKRRDDMEQMKTQQKHQKVSGTQKDPSDQAKGEAAMPFNKDPLQCDPEPPDATICQGCPRTAVASHKGGSIGNLGTSGLVSRQHNAMAGHEGGAGSHFESTGNPASNMVQLFVLNEEGRPVVLSGHKWTSHPT